MTPELTASLGVEAVGVAVIGAEIDAAVVMRGRGPQALAMLDVDLVAPDRVAGGAVERPEGARVGAEIEEIVDQKRGGFGHDAVGGSARGLEAPQLPIFTARDEAFLFCKCETEIRQA